MDSTTPAARRAYREKNKEKLRAQEKARRLKNKERIAAQRSQYYLADRERALARVKAYQAKNKEVVAVKKAAALKTPRGKALSKIYCSRYYAKNREKLLALKRVKNEQLRPALREAAAKKRHALHDSYIRQLMHLPASVIPPALIAAERLRMLIAKKIRGPRNEEACRMRVNGWQVKDIARQLCVSNSYASRISRKDAT